MQIEVGMALAIAALTTTIMLWLVNQIMKLAATLASLTTSVVTLASVADRLNAKLDRHLETHAAQYYEGAQR